MPYISELNVYVAIIEVIQYVYTYLMVFVKSIQYKDKGDVHYW